MTDLTLLSAWLSAFVLGLMSSGHCFGMCGGISGAFGIANTQHNSRKRWIRILTYNTGRITCYALLGLIVGFSGQLFVQQFHSLMIPLRIVAGLMLIAMACYLSQWWMGILVFERFGQRLWRYIQPLSLRFTPLQHLGQVYCFGVLWGLLPCGLVYSMLVWAGSFGKPFSAVLLMIGFGLGTLPAMLVSGYSATQLRKILQHQHLRMAISLLLIVFATWTIVSALQHGSAAEHSGHHHGH